MPRRIFQFSFGDGYAGSAKVAILSSYLLKEKGYTYSEEDFETRNTTNQYDENVEYVEASVATQFERKFKKENRNLKIDYNLRSQTNSSVDILDNSDFDVFNNVNLFSTLQNKNGKSKSLQHYGFRKLLDHLRGSLC